ncbi:MAG: glutamine amidotransferase [Anaerolineae bacterium]
MSNIRVLLAGESWISNSTHFKGWDFFSSTSFETGINYLQKALVVAGIEFTHLPNHLADTHFPNTTDGLANYDVILLSDIGSNTLLLHPDTWLRGKSTPNRLRLLKEWVNQGGGLAMCGGYYSFAGIYGAARYHRTPIEEVLPVSISPYDDRVETPEGTETEVVAPEHPILSGIASAWPALLGFNEITLKPGAQLLAKVGDYPLLAVQSVGQGRTLAWASDIGPHWCPEPFATWEGYARLWVQAVEWLAGRR